MATGSPPRSTRAPRASLVAAGALALGAASGCARPHAGAGTPQPGTIAWASPPAPAWGAAFNDASPPGAGPALSPPPAAAAVPPPVAPAAAAPPAVYAFHRAFDRALDEGAPARRLADLTPAQCREEIARRELPVVRSKTAAKGVASPFRVSGPLRGVALRTAPASSPYGTMDCRLALALDEMAGIVATFGVREVRIDNTYRPSAHLPGRKKLSQHAHALAADVVSMTLEDGRVLSVAEHWHAPIGSAPCGPDATVDPPTDEAILLRTIVCEVAARGVFHHVLTPSYDAAHRDHLHLDIKRDTERRSVR